MFLNDVDPLFLKSVNCLYSGDTPKGDGVNLQHFLEEAIKSKTGVAKDLSGLVTHSLKQRRVGEFKSTFITPIDESKGSNSDNELELDLLKEDLMCIICNGMDVGARNRLLECSDCHMLYHQECHKPIVIVQDSYDSWVCQNCKDASKKLKQNSTSTGSTSNTGSHGKTSTTPSSSSSSSSSKPSSSSSSSSSHRTHSSSSYKSGSSTSRSDKYSKSNSSSKSSSSSSSKPTSRSNVTPNINIISADKRIQIMKKKAAKLQEKRKHVAIH